MFSGLEPVPLVDSMARPAGAERETITPHKLALLVLVHQYCEARQRPAAGATPRQRKDACLLLLQLLQGAELDGWRLRRVCRRRLPANHMAEFQLRLGQLRRGGVEALTELVAAVELLVVDHTSRKAAVAASSVVGFFLRRMLLAFERLPFHGVTRVFAEFSGYHEGGRWPAAGCRPDAMDVEHDAEYGGGGDDSDGDDDLPHDSAEWEGQRPSRRQAELIVSRQMELLQINENLALRPAALQEVASRLLRDSPDLAEAHFLSFLNCLRVNELSGAVHSLYHSFDRMGAAAGHDDDSRGLRYAALSLATLHAWFGHRAAALAAIRESVTMAQDANDSVCLQQALTWLYKLADDEETRECLMRHAIAKSEQLNLPELASLGVQNYTQLMAQRGAPPADAFQQLSRSDHLNCQHSLPALMASGYAVRAALCQLYGRPALAALCGQLLLCLDTSGAGQHGAPVCGEPAALAAGQVARQLAGGGHYVMADQVLVWAADQFPAGSAPALLVRRQLLELEADRALLAGHCRAAEETAAALTVLDPAAGRLRRAQVHLLRGELSECERLLADLLSAQPEPERRVQLLLLRGELLLAGDDLTGAGEPLLAALAVCQQRRLDGARRSVLLRLASVLLQLGIVQRAHQLAEQLCLPLLTHGTQHERARLQLLRARCLLAQQPPQRRCALRLLDESARLLNHLQAWLLLKTVLHLRAVVYHELGMRADRNAASWQYRQLVTQHQTGEGVHLLRIS